MYRDRDNIKYQIIFNIRKHGTISLAKLMDIVLGHSEFKGVTGDADFIQTILNLYRVKFLSIDISDDVKSKIENKYFKTDDGYAKLSDGYDFALRINPEKVFLKITDYFFRMQEAIGFSVSDQLSKRVGWHETIWGKINEKLKTQVFVIMPFNEEISPVYFDHILNVCSKIGYECKRADDIFASSNIVNDIFSMIHNSEVIICDCTGKNANVFYELGVAHAMGKNVICITQNEADIPFDISQIRYIKYDYTPRGMIIFEDLLEKYIAISMSDAMGL